MSVRPDLIRRPLLTLEQDTRATLRALRRAPAFTATAVLLMTLGIGATTATYSVIDTAMFRPLPLPSPQQLVTVANVDLPYDLGRTIPKVQPYIGDLDGLGVFSAVAAEASGAMNFGVGGEAARVPIAYVTTGYFRTMGRAPILGRSFTAAEGTNGGDWHVAILSHGLWMQQFGGSQQVLGRSFTLNNHEYRVVGVMPADFTFPSAPALWLPFPLPISTSEVFEAFGMYIPTSIVARLRPGASVQSADAAVVRLERDYATWSYMTDSAGVLVKPMESSLMSTNARHALFALGAAAVLVLTLAALNLAGLLSARGMRRERELAVRVALGASSGDIVRLFFVEALVLSAAGAGGGILVARLSMRTLDALLPPKLLAIAQPSLDLRLLVFAIGVSLLVSAAMAAGFGVRMGREATAGLGHSTRPASFRRTRALRELLSGMQIALALVLVVAAGLMVHTFHRLATVQTGMELRNAAVGRITLPRTAYASGSAVMRFVQSTVTDLRGGPGIQAAGAVDVLPIAGRAGFGEALISPNVPGDTLMPMMYAVTPGYFASLGIPLLAGRDFDWSDHPYAGLIINVAAAKRLWPGENPLGQQVFVGGRLRGIIGLVGNVRTRRLADRATPQAYVPFAEVPANTVNLVVRGTIPLSAMASRIRDAVRTVDPHQPVYGVQRMEDLVLATISDERSASILLTAFGIVALALATIGVYGLTAYGIAGRRREFAIRIAVGAKPSDVLVRIVARASVLGICGVSVGVVLVLAAGRLVSNMIYGMPAFSVRGLGGAIVTLFAAVMLAAFMPALRGVRVLPMEVFRSD